MLLNDLIVAGPAIQLSPNCHPTVTQLSYNCHLTVIQLTHPTGRSARACGWHDGWMPLSSGWWCSSPSQRHSAGHSWSASPGTQSRWQSEWWCASKHAEASSCVSVCKGGLFPRAGGCKRHSSSGPSPPRLPLLFDDSASLLVPFTHSEREEAAEAVRHMRSEAGRLQQPRDGVADPSSFSPSSWPSSSRLEAALDELVAQVSAVFLAEERMAMISCTGYGMAKGARTCYGMVRRPKPVHPVGHISAPFQSLSFPSLLPPPIPSWPCIQVSRRVEGDADTAWAVSCMQRLRSLALASDRRAHETATDAHLAQGDARSASLRIGSLQVGERGRGQGSCFRSAGTERGREGPGGARRCEGGTTGQGGYHRVTVCAG